jgi:hypothetical protein
VTPHYDEDGITIYHGDCRYELPAIYAVDHIITDPPYSRDVYLRMRASGKERGESRVAAVYRVARIRPRREIMPTDPKPTDRVAVHIQKQMKLVIEGLEDNKQLEQLNNVDWLAVAIGRMGGPQAAAEELGVTRQTVYSWLAQGLGTLPFNRVIEIAEKSRSTLEVLKQRTGPRGSSANSRVRG